LIGRWPGSRRGAIGALAPVALALSILALIWPALAHAEDVWATTEEFSFGFLIIPVSLAVIWWRRRRLFESVSVGAGATWRGLAVILPSLLVYLVGWRLGIHALAGIAVPPLLLGISIFLWGVGAGRVLAFPLGFLIFGLGLYRGLLDSVGFALQGITATGAYYLAHGLGVAVQRDGLTLSSDRFAFIVADTCSGMSSLVSLLALAALWTYAARGSLAGRAAVVLSVVPLVILANSTRVALVLVVASNFGQDAALGFFHGASSLVLFGFALSGLLLISRMVGCKPATSFAL
jgi:exosortase